MVAWYEGLEDMVVSGLKHRTRRPGTADMSMIKNFKEKRLHFYWPYPFVANLKSRVLRTTGWNENKCTRYICPLVFFCPLKLDVSYCGSVLSCSDVGRKIVLEHKG